MFRPLFLFYADVETRLPTWTTRTTVRLRILMPSDSITAASKMAKRITRSYGKRRQWSDPNVTKVKYVGEIDQVQKGGANNV